MKPGKVMLGVSTALGTPTRCFICGKDVKSFVNVQGGRDGLVKICSGCIPRYMKDTPYDFEKIIDEVRS